MGEFNSDDHYIYYWGQESLRRNGIAIIVKKRVQNAWMQSQKWQNDLCSFPRKSFNIMIIQVYVLTSNAEEAEVEWFYEDLQDFLELIPKKRCFFHYRGLECKSRKSGNTWSNRQIWTWSTDWSRAKADRVLPRERMGHSKHPLPTTQENTLHGHHQMVNTEIRLICSQRWRSSIQLQKQDRELTVAQVMNSSLPYSDLNWRKWEIPLDHSGMT